MDLTEVGAAKEFAARPAGPRILDAPEHPKIAALHAYLESKRRGRPFADRRDVNPAEIASLLPHLVVLDVVDGGNDFRVRIWGTALVDLMHEERTGQLVSEFGNEPGIPTDPIELRKRWLTVAQLTMKAAKPLFFKAPTVAPERAFMTYHCMFAPLTAGAADIEQIIGMLVVVGLR